LIRAVKTDGETGIRPEEILVSQEILLASVLSSINDGKRVPLTELKNDFTVTGRFGTRYP